MPVCFNIICSFCWQSSWSYWLGLAFHTTSFRIQKLGIRPCHGNCENFYGIIVLFLEFDWLVCCVSACWMLIWSCCSLVQNLFFWLILWINLLELRFSCSIASIHSYDYISLVYSIRCLGIRGYSRDEEIIDVFEMVVLSFFLSIIILKIYFFPNLPFTLLDSFHTIPIDSIRGDDDEIKKNIGFNHSPCWCSNWDWSFKVMRK